MLIKWSNDKDYTKCYNCHNKFSFFLRKHHCRKCGKIYCYKCLTYYLENNIKIYICNNCINNFTMSDKSTQTPLHISESNTKSDNILECIKLIHTKESKKKYIKEI